VSAPPDIRVDRARGRDALPVLGLYRDVLAEGRWFATALAESSLTLEALEERFRDSTQAWFVARAGHALLGWVSLTPGSLASTRHVAALELMVASGARGRGVGRALVAAALGWAADTPALEKVVLAVLADNERALRLYRDAGFAEEGRRIGQYRLGGVWRDDVLMARPVR